jgi:antitoxin MazE
MRVQVAKWGNSLAVRLPAECARAVGLRDGDRVDLRVGPAGEITLTPERPFDKDAFVERLRRLRAGMPMTSSTVETLRDEERY